MIEALAPQNIVPPGGEDGSLRCEQCGEPATWQIAFDGCRHCGGVDCGDSGDIEYGCERHPFED